MTTKTAQILALLAKSPDLTVAEIAEKLDFNKTKTSGLISTMKGRVVGTNIEGSNIKRYRLADDTTPPPKAGKAPRKKKRAPKAAAAVVVPPAPESFQVGITADKSLLVMDIDTLMFKVYSPDQCGAIADLLLQHFEA